MMCFLILLLGINCSSFKHLQFHTLWVLSTVLCINLGNFVFKYVINLYFCN